MAIDAKRHDKKRHMIQVRPDIYEYLLRKKHELERKLNTTVSMDQVLRALINYRTRPKEK